MKIMVKDIPAVGLEFTRDIQPASIGITAEDLKCLTPLTVNVKAERIRNAITVWTQVKGSYVFVCSRCLESIEITGCEEFKFNYVVEPGIVSIDVGEDIRQEMIVLIPLKMLCREDCKGVCIKCGTNLNHESCKCK